jgi:hypothetical protein
MSSEPCGLAPRSRQASASTIPAPDRVSFPGEHAIGWTTSRDTAKSRSAIFVCMAATLCATVVWLSARAELEKPMAGILNRDTTCTPVDSSETSLNMSGQRRQGACRRQTKNTVCRDRQVRSGFCCCDRATFSLTTPATRPRAHQMPRLLTSSRPDLITGRRSPRRKPRIDGLDPRHRFFSLATSATRH